MVASFRKKDAETPIVLMGYYNPIYIFGVDDFLKDAKSAGVDGLIVVDLPPEEDDELCLPALKAGIKDVVFDRGGYLYHGRVKALADAAREAGLNF